MLQLCVQETMMSLPAESSTVKETMVTCIEAPRLKRISIKHSIDFKGNGEFYQERIIEKERQLREGIVFTSCRASMEDVNLQSIHICPMGRSTICSFVHDMTVRQTRHCVEEWCKKR